MKIINTIPIYETIYHPGWSWLGFYLGVMTLFFIVAAIYCFYDKLWLPAIVATLATGFMIFGCIFNFKNAIEEKVFNYNEYIVQIDDTVDIKEFNKKYEMIEYIGEGVYKVIERGEK